MIIVGGSAYALHLGYVLGSRAFLTLLNLEGHHVAIGEGFVSFADDCGVMNENVRAAVIRGDEAEALLFIEPLYLALRHVFFLHAHASAQILASRTAAMGSDTRSKNSCHPGN